MYELLGSEPYVSSLPWKHVHVFFGDERAVPPDSPESNYRMARESLLDRVPIEKANIHRIEAEAGIDEAAEKYDQLLCSIGKQHSLLLPKLDLILLGLGPDGHTASLFPDTPALEETASLAAAVRLPLESAGYKDAPERVTVTFPLINASRSVIFLVSGKDKAEPLEAIEGGNESLPAARVKPVDCEPLWLVAGT